MRITRSVLARGALAGAVGAAVQALVGKLEERAFLPHDGDADLAPRLAERLAERAGYDLSEAGKWVLGTGFHYGYGAAWGMTYAAADRRLPLHPVIGGSLLGGFIYAITFPRWGGAVQLDVVEEPRRREPAMTAFGWSAALAFGLTTSLANAAMRPPGEWDDALITAGFSDDEFPDDYLSDDDLSDDDLSDDDLSDGDLSDEA